MKTHVTISRLVGGDAERIRIDIETPELRLKVDMTPEQFGLCVTGRGASEAELVKFYNRTKDEKQ